MILIKINNLINKVNNSANQVIQSKKDKHNLLNLEKKSVKSKIYKVFLFL